MLQPCLTVSAESEVEASACAADAFASLLADRASCALASLCFKSSRSRSLSIHQSRAMITKFENLQPHRCSQLIVGAQQRGFRVCWSHNPFSAGSWKQIL